MLDFFKWPRVAVLLLFLFVGVATPYLVLQQEEHVRAVKTGQEEVRSKEVAALSYQQPVITLSPEEMPIMESVTSTRAVALLIDNSWNYSLSSLLVFALKSNNAHATFFVAGNWASEHPDICRLITQEGNELGVLGNHSDQYDKQSPNWIKDDIEKSAGQIKGVSGVQPVLYLAGNGTTNPSVVRAAAGAGFKAVTGKVDARNHIQNNQSMIIGRLMQSISPGAIVVFHAADNTKNLASTIDALLKRLEQQQYQVLSISELLMKYSEKGVARKPL